MALVYISTHYPAVSHTFVLREVGALRALGVDVQTVSVRRAADADALTARDREERDRTFAILPIARRGLLASHARAFLRRPRGYLRALARAQRMSLPGLRPRLWQLFYFAEAMVLCDRYAGVDRLHLHAQFADAATDVALLATVYQPAWRWSLAVHGPVEFYDITAHRLREKVRRAHLVVAISHFGRSQLLTLLDEEMWDKVHVVRCGVDPAEFAPPPKRAGAGPMHVVCVGRLINLKGQSLIVEAAAELASRGVDIRVTLVGDGPRREHLQALAELRGVADRVRLTGSLGQDEVRRLLLEADAFCLPSFAEGVPVSLMEAMAVELPVVTTRIMGVPELVEDGRTGLLVTPGRLDALVDALERLAHDVPLRAELGRAGRRRVAEEFDVGSSARRLQELFATTA